MQTNTKFFEKIFDLFSSVKVPDYAKDVYELNQLVYYHADKTNTAIKIINKPIYEVDIKSAFPTICHQLFPAESDFIQKLDSFDDKLAKNIHISTTLKDTGYLQQLNLISKMVICSVVFDSDPSALILELKKDGVIYIGEPLNHNKKLYKTYINDYNFTIKENKYQKYIRYARTSIFQDDNITIKGIFKDRPPFLMEQLRLILSDMEYDKNLLKYYSSKYWEIIRLNNLDELFLNFYNCESKYLLPNFRYNSIKKIEDCNINPITYLKLFIFPILNLNI